MSTAPVLARDVVAAQRRVVRTLVVSQSVGAVGITIGVSTASLLARDLSGSESQAGLAQTSQVLGAAVAAYLLARVMAARGRRVGLVLGLVLGAVGASLAVLAGVLGSMWLLLVGALLLGCTSAANAGARYAATDLAPREHKARALSVVVWATTLGAVVGPNLTGPAAAFARFAGIPDLTGPFALAAIGMLVSALVLVTFLRPDPLLTARAAEGVRAPVLAGSQMGRAVAAFRADIGLLAGVVALAGAHVVMVSVMIMTPLHMEHGGAELRVIGFVISIHVLGMYAFSPGVGWLADQLGRRTVLLTGAVLSLVSLLLCGRSPEGSSAEIFGGLFLLGLGWSFATIAASSTVADRAPLEVRTDVQGVADMAMWLAAAAGGGLSGLIVAGWSYAALTVFSAVLVTLVVVAALVPGREAVPG